MSVLTPRQAELCQLLMWGCTMAEAAEEMHISYSTARELSHQARERVHAKTLPQLVGICVQKELVSHAPRS